jgi:hypothetical protein
VTKLRYVSLQVTERLSNVLLSTLRAKDHGKGLRKTTPEAADLRRNALSGYVGRLGEGPVASGKIEGDENSDRNASLRSGRRRQAYNSTTYAQVAQEGSVERQVESVFKYRTVDRHARPRTRRRLLEWPCDVIAAGVDSEVCGGRR